MSLPEVCRDYVATGSLTQGQLADLNLKISTLEAEIPLATDPRVRESIESMAKSGVSTTPEFTRGYLAPLASLTSDLDTFHGELVSASRNGGTRYELPASLKRRLRAMPIYDDLIKAKQNLSPKLKGVLTCLHDRRNIGASRVNGGLIAIGALSVIVSGGASLSGIALATGTRVGLVAADLALSGAGAVQSVDAIYNSCYKDTTALATGGKCDPQQSFNFILLKTTNASCAANFAFGAGPVILAGASAGIRALRTADSAATDVRAVTEGEEIVVTARARAPSLF